LLSVVSQDVRFYSHVNCPVSHFSAWILVGLPMGVFGFWFVGLGIVVGVLGKWESLFLGISKGQWERWKTGVWFSTVSTALGLRPGRERLSIGSVAADGVRAVADRHGFIQMLMNGYSAAGQGAAKTPLL